MNAQTKTQLVSLFREFAAALNDDSLNEDARQKAAGFMASQFGYMADELTTPASERTWPSFAAMFIQERDWLAAYLEEVKTS